MYIITYIYTKYFNEKSIGLRKLISTKRWYKSFFKLYGVHVLILMVDMSFLMFNVQLNQTLHMLCVYTNYCFTLYQWINFAIFNTTNQPPPPNTQTPTPTHFKYCTCSEIFHQLIHIIFCQLKKDEIWYLHDWD